MTRMAFRAEVRSLRRERPVVEWSDMIAASTVDAATESALAELQESMGLRRCSEPEWNRTLDGREIMTTQVKAPRRRNCWTLYVTTPRVEG